jgi:hypothetical protein
VKDLARRAFPKLAYTVIERTQKEVEDKAL